MQLLKIKDLIEFINRDTKENLLVEIEDLFIYDSFAELYKNLNKLSVE
jgi:ASC-1-like (ASCH) protein